jgi:hypothetical protein
MNENVLYSEDIIFRRQGMKMYSQSMNDIITL